MAQKKKLPKDTNTKAKSIVDMATGEDAPLTSDGKNPAAVAQGRKWGGGLKGGSAHKAALSPKRRKEIAQKAAAARLVKKTSLLILAFLFFLEFLSFHF